MGKGVWTGGLFFASGMASARKNLDSDSEEDGASTVRGASSGLPCAYKKVGAFFKGACGGSLASLAWKNSGETTLAARDAPALCTDDARGSLGVGVV
jgi:hypothetical protein